MTPINNSDTAWLITADFNQDNNIGFPEALREDIISPDVNGWEYEYLRFYEIRFSVGGLDCGCLVGNTTSTNMGLGVGWSEEYTTGFHVGGNHP